MNDFPELNGNPLITDYKAIIYQYSRHWRWILLSIAVCCAIAFIYIRYTTPVFSSYSTILIKIEEKGTGDVSAAFQDLSVFQSDKNVNNEISILKGIPLMRRVMQELNLDITYYIEGAIKETELYGDIVPIKVLLEETGPAAFGKRMEIEAVNGDTFSLTDEEGSIQAKFGTLVKRPYASFRVIQHAPSSGNPIIVQFNDIKKLGNLYNDKLQITANDNDASVLTISLIDPLQDKAIDIINKLIELYQLESTDDKNQIAQNTVKFIDARLSSLVGDLETVEKNVEQFKKGNRLVDVNAQAQSNLQGVADYNRQIADIQTQIAIVQSLENYLKLSSKDDLIPGTVGVKDEVLGSLIQKYNELQLARQSLLKNAQLANPLVVNMDGELRELRRNILDNLMTIQKTLKISADSQSRQVNAFRSGVSSIPTIERNLLEISRQQAIKENLYAYLLQKREEAAISLASSVSNIRIINPGISNKIPVNLNQKNIYLISFLIGLLFPVGFIYVRYLLNDKIENELDLDRITQVPVLGTLVHSDENQALVVNKNLRTEIAELFRLIRTNLKFALSDYTNSKVMAVTSSMAGEGKTFFCINMGASFAITGEKTVILEFDIRKPKLLKDLGMSGDKSGITNYLINPELRLEDLIQPVKQLEGLYVIGAGPLPPNPAELLTSRHIQGLIHKLKEEFDHIIIDTSPVGQVADAFTLGALADTSIYIVRYNYTFKQQLNVVKDIYDKKKLRNLMIVMNDAKKGNSYGNGYGYGYGYGYETKESVNWKQKIKRFLLNKR